MCSLNWLRSARIANDYHRYHFPLDGVIKELRVIPGEDALGGSITWEPQLQQYVVDCSVPGWQSIETRDWQ